MIYVLEYKNAKKKIVLAFLYIRYLLDFIFLNLLYHFLDILSNLYEVLVKDAFPFIP